MNLELRPSNDPMDLLFDASIGRTMQSTTSTRIDVSRGQIGVKSSIFSLHIRGMAPKLFR